MRYQPNYQNQFFMDENRSLTIAELFHVAKDHTQYKRVPMPLDPQLKIIYLIAGIFAGLDLLTTLATFIISRSIAFAIVIMLIMMVFLLGIFFIIVSVYKFIIAPKKCTVPVEAKCIGYSISHSGNSHGRPARSPVFTYEYNGYNFTAFDSVYENHISLPEIGSICNILVNPEDPEDLVWKQSKGRAAWFIAGGIFGIVLSIAIFSICFKDQNFMDSVKYDKLKAEGKVTEQGDILSDDGRIIMDDKWIEKTFPDNLKGQDFIIGIRRVDQIIPYEEGKAFLFEDNAAYVNPGIKVKEENLTEAMKNAKQGDEYYFIEIGENGATLYSCKEYVYTGNKELK